MSKTIVTSGNRVYLKFFDLDYFRDRAGVAYTEIEPCVSLDEKEFLVRAAYGGPGSNATPLKGKGLKNNVNRI